MSLFIRVRQNLAKTLLRKPLVALRHFGLTSSDVFIASYPRSGSTWLRFLLCEILTGEPSEFKSKIVMRTIPYVGDHFNAPRILPNKGRLIKTHERYSLCYKKALYVVRDVRDVVVSEHSYQLWNRYHNQSLDQFIEMFINGTSNQFGSWVIHVGEWLRAKSRGDCDLMVVKYEDLRHNTEGTLTEIMKFLGKTADAEVIRRAIENNSVENMRRKEDKAKTTMFKNRRQDIRFIRKGQTGGWEETLTPEQIANLERYAGDILHQLQYATRFT